MPTTPEAIAADIAEAATAGFRGRLIARGQARAIIWRNGALPADAPAFAPQLSYDLHSYACSLLGLGLGLRLRELGGDPTQARTAFEQAATALEAVMAKSNREEVNRDFHFVTAAAAYHLSHLSARAYSLLAVVAADENFSPVERTLALLMRRNFGALRSSILDYRASGQGSDGQITQAWLDQADGVAAAPDAGRDDFLFDGLDTALTDTFMAAMSLYLLALNRGERALVNQALERLRVSLTICGEMNMLPQWWAHRVAIHLLSDLWSSTFHERIPLQPAGGVAADWPRLRELFIASLQRRAKAEIDLWPSQTEAAARAVDQSDDLVVSLPARRALPNSASALPRRRQTDGVRDALARPLSANRSHTPADLRPARQDHLGPLWQHRRQRLRRGCDPRALHRSRDAGEARLRSSQ